MYILTYLLVAFISLELQIISIHNTIKPRSVYQTCMFTTLYITVLGIYPHLGLFIL